MEKPEIITGPDDVKKYVIMKDGGLMPWEDWMKLDAEKTEDAEFEVIENKQLPPVQDKT